jgi:hypothetical protein
MEELIQKSDAGIATQQAIRLEERHFLSEIALTQILALDRSFDSRQCAPRHPRAQGANRDDAHFPVFVDDGALEHLHCSRRPDLGESDDSGDAHFRLADREHFSERGHRSG